VAKLQQKQLTEGVKEKQSTKATITN
jgi:hypothetical protein